MDESDIPIGTVQPRPYFLINQVQLAMVSQLEKSLRSIGLTPAIGRVLNAIAVRPKISSVALARMLGITPQSIKQSVLALERAGLIERTPLEEDQRVLTAQLTAAGWALREQQIALIDAMYADVFGALTQAEMTGFIDTLVKIVTHARPKAMEYLALSSPGLTAGERSIAKEKERGR